MECATNVMEEKIPSEKLLISFLFCIETNVTRSDIIMIYTVIFWVVLDDVLSITLNISFCYK